MKKIFLAVVALAAMTACSNDEFVSVDRAPINFGEAFVDNATRATDTTYGAVDLELFNVYGTMTGAGNTVNIFNGVALTGEVGDDVWAYKDPNTENQYWLAKASYNFAAVVDATVTNPKANNYMPTELAPKASDNGSNFKDMLYATATATVNEAGVPSVTNGVVNFTFEHLLSKVQFTVTSNATGSYSHSVTGIKVKNFATGTYTIAYEDDGDDISYWTGTTPTDIEFGKIEGVNADSKETVGSTTTPGLTNATQMLLIPTTGPFDVTFTVEVYRKNGENNKTLVSTETNTVTVTDKPLVKGNAYNFTIACSLNSPIKFSVTNNPTWDDEDPITIQ